FVRFDWNLSHVLFSVEPMKLTSPSTDAEVELALRVLEGCCLIHPQSTALAHQHNAIQVLMNILSTRGVLEQGACLDALISLVMDSSSNQMISVVANEICQRLPSKKFPLIILHNKRIKGDKMDEPINRALIDKWNNADALYATPTGSNDDCLWLNHVICLALFLFL
ncbi:Pentatricopeptide repeat-containing protein, mitochondrial, partial [Glycine soja]